MIVVINNPNKSKEQNMASVEAPAEMVEKDCLGMSEKCKGLVNFIKKCSTPMTVAVQGDWGIGKTFAMKLIKNELKDDMHCVWIDTWQFSALPQDSNVFVEFVFTLYDLLDGEGKSKKNIKSLIADFLDGAKNSENAVISLGGLIGASIVHKDGTVKSRTMFLAEICDELKKKAEMVLEEKGSGKDKGKADRKKKICIFIDDLDRLKPQMAIEILEGLKNFVKLENCIFVLAIEKEVIVEGLTSKYGSQVNNVINGGRTRADMFFDKIIQVPFTIRKENHNISGLVEKIIGTAENAPADNGKIINHKNYTNILTGLKLYNPRSIERYFNLTGLYEYIHKAEKNDYTDVDYHDIKTLLTFMVVALEIEYKDIYDTMNEHVCDVNDDSEAIAEIKQLCQEAEIREKSVYDCFVDTFGVVFKNSQENTIKNTFKITNTNPLTDEQRYEKKIEKIINVLSDAGSIDAELFRPCLNSGSEFNTITTEDKRFAIGWNKKDNRTPYIKLGALDESTYAETVRFLETSDRFDRSDMSKNRYFLNKDKTIAVYFTCDRSTDDIEKLFGVAKIFSDTSEK